MKYLYSDLSQFGLTVPHPSKGAVSSVVYKHDAPLLDVGTVALIRTGTTLERVDDDAVRSCVCLQFEF